MREEIAWARARTSKTSCTHTQQHTHAADSKWTKERTLTKQTWIYRDFSNIKIYLCFVKVYLVCAGECKYLLDSFFFVGKKYVLNVNLFPYLQIEDKFTIYLHKNPRRINVDIRIPSFKCNTNTFRQTFGIYKIYLRILARRNKKNIEINGRHVL